jgi:hypothetical protein
VTVSLSEVQAGSLSYQIAGARDSVLALRALNGRGQPLASQSSVTSDFLLGEGLSGRTDYAGVVNQVEVVFAAEEQTLQVPFTLTDFTLAGKPGPVVLDQAPAFQPYSAQILQRDPSSAGGHGSPAKPDAGVSLGPFVVSFDKAQAFYAVKLDFTIRSPALPNFEKAFTVGEFRLTRIRLKDGTALESPPTADEPTSPSGIRARWETPIRFDARPKDEGLAKAVNLWIDAKVTPEDLAALQGILTIQFPKKLQTLSLEDLSPGRQARMDELTVTVTARGRKSVTLQTNRDGSRVLYVRLLNAEGQAVAFFGPQITTSPDGAWRFELSPLSPPVRAEVILAQELDHKAYPFVLAVK